MEGRSARRPTISGMAGHVPPVMADGFPELVAEIDRLLDAADPSNPLRGTVAQLPYYGRCECTPTCNVILTAPAGSAGTLLVELELDGEAVIWLSLDPTATAIVEIEVLDPEALGLPAGCAG
jgi:hypothetical protein